MRTLRHRDNRTYPKIRDNRGVGPGIQHGQSDSPATTGSRGRGTDNQWDAFLIQSCKTPHNMTSVFISFLLPNKFIDKPCERRKKESIVFLIILYSSRAYSSWVLDKDSNLHFWLKSSLLLCTCACHTQDSLLSMCFCQPGQEWTPVSKSACDLDFNYCWASSYQKLSLLGSIYFNLSDPLFCRLWKWGIQGKSLVSSRREAKRHIERR